MAFIQTPSKTASPSTAELFKAAEASYGYLPNMHRLFGHRPEVMEAWSALLATIRTPMSLRRYELVTIAAARELKSSYCMLAHAGVLKREGLTEAELAAIARLEPDAPLTEAEWEIMRFAAKVAHDASAVTQEDINLLLAQGLTDAEIFDIAAAAAARCFYSKLLDSLGATPDAIYRDTLGEDLLKILALGRSPDTAR